MVLVCAGLSLCLYATLAKAEAQGQWAAMTQYYHMQTTQMQAQLQQQEQQVGSDTREGRTLFPRGRMIRISSADGRLVRDSMRAMRPLY